MAVNKYKDGRDNPWYCTFYYTDWTGVRHRKKKEGFALKRDAQDYEDEYLKKSSRSCDMLFSSLVEYYRDDQRNRTRPRTQDTDNKIIDLWLLPYFGKLPLNEIDAGYVRLWQSKLMDMKNPRTGQGYSGTYLRMINIRLSAIMNYAVKYYDLERNPCLAAGKIGKAAAKRMSFWTLDQFNTFLSKITKPDYRVAFLLLYWTGMREGECLALTLADILPSKAINVDKSFYHRNGEDLVGPPKTEHGRRILSIPDSVYDETQSYIKSLYAPQPNDRIFRFYKGHLGYEMRNKIVAAGLPSIRLHDLRHSHASLLIEMGNDIPSVAARLGDTIQVAMGTYIHLYPNKMDRITTGLNDVSKNGLSPVKKS